MQSRGTITFISLVSSMSNVTIAKKKCSPCITFSTLYCTTLYRPVQVERPPSLCSSSAISHADFSSLQTLQMFTHLRMHAWSTCMHTQNTQISPSKVQMHFFSVRMWLFGNPKTTAHERPVSTRWGSLLSGVHQHNTCFFDVLHRLLTSVKKMNRSRRKTRHTISKKWAEKQLSVYSRGGKH